MQLTIIGSSGSLAGPTSPASCYLLVPDDGSAPVIMDIGSGAMGVLAQVTDPAAAHVVITHLHADHCLDFPSLLVWRRFHPTAASAGKHTFIGPEFAAEHLGLASADKRGEVDDFSDTMDIRTWSQGETQRVGAFDITPTLVVHPAETYALKVVERATGHSLVFSADTAPCEALTELARGAHTLLCEAGWGVDSDGCPPDMHMDAREAALTAAEAGVQRLIITHVPPWEDAYATEQRATEFFAGEVALAQPLDTFTFAV